MVSPLLSNLYLDSLDHLLAEKGIERVRYADDFVVLCRTEVAAQEALERVRDGTTTVGLTLHPVKTRIVDATQDGGFDFLGYHFAGGERRPRKKSLDKFKDTIRAKTRRHNGQSLQTIFTDLNWTLRGWFEYFQHRRRFVFITLDKWVRMRLRSLLRFRRKRKGRGRGSDPQRWPMLSLPSRVSSPELRLIPWPVNPLGGKTTHWRAGCGRTACPVRREGARPIPLSLPLSKARLRRAVRANIDNSLSISWR